MHYHRVSDPVLRQRHIPTPLMTSLSALVLVVGISTGCAPSDDRPNLLFISMDTTRADHIGAYGHDAAHTPAIDGLAATGFTFHNHFTPVPITLPGHTSMMTGHYPATHGVHDNGTFVVPQEELTLAEVLQSTGYDTSAFVGSFPMTAQFGLDQGFATFDDKLGVSDRDRPDQLPGVFFDERNAGAVVDAVIAHHRKPSQGPFFTFVHVFDPHQPLNPPPPYDIEYRDRLYDGEIAYVDAQISRLLAFFSEREELSNTIIVLTSDHGEGHGEHGELTHAMLLHRGTLRVPLIIKGPGVSVGATRTWTTSTQLFDTLLDLLGVDPPPAEVPRSASLQPIMESGGDRPTDYPEFTAYFETIAPRTSQGWSQLVGWQRGDWRLIHGPSPRLWQLAADPSETTNLFTEEPQRSADLFAELVGFLERFETRPVGDSIVEMDTETAERLAALGYLRTDTEDLTSFTDILDVEGRIDPAERVIDIAAFSEAKAAMARQNWTVARAHWVELLRVSPDNTVAAQNLAIIQAVTGDWDGCFLILEAALQRQPDSATAKRLYGSLLIEAGRYREGIDVLVQMPTDSLEATTWLGRGYQGLGEVQEAKIWYRRGLEIEPGNRWLRLYLANRLAEEGASDEAEELYLEIISDSPYFHLAYYNLGTMLSRAGRIEEGRRILERAIQLAPQHQPTRDALALLENRDQGDQQ